MTMCSPISLVIGPFVRVQVIPLLSQGASNGCLYFVREVLPCSGGTEGVAMYNPFIKRAEADQDDIRLVERFTG